jgi:hypothetical protein
MSKKKPIKKIFDNTSIESADAHPEMTESVQADAQSEETSTDTNPQEEIPEVSIENEESSSEDSLMSSEPNIEITESDPTNVQNEPTPSDESLQEVMEMSADSEESPGQDSSNLENAEEGTANEDLLDDVRRSLIEEESDRSQKESKWWRRIGRKKKSAETEKPSGPVEMDLPTMPDSAEPAEVQSLKDETEEEVDQIDDLLEMLKVESEEGSVETTAAPEVETPSEPEPEIDFDELKKQAFRPRAEGEEEPEHLTDVRSIALEGGEEVLVEVEAKPTDTMQERISAFENALKPYRQYIYITVAFLGVVVAAIAALIIFNVYQRSRPQSVAPVSNLPYPASVSLPGGWSFKLGRGTLQNGKWDPKGAEWLEGTEVCRWVALPWSRQLEAVIRTLNPKDPIELVMSNNDKFVYQVYSVRQLSPEEMQQLDSNSACLLLILTQPDVEKRWVLTAVP